MLRIWTSGSADGHRKVAPGYFGAAGNGARRDSVLYRGMGEFDALFARTVRALKRDHPSLRLVQVMPYLTRRLNTDKAYYETLYDEILIPAELDSVHPKKAISLRNRWMVDHSDFVVTALHRNYGGAAEAVSYANAKACLVIPVFEARNAHSAEKECKPGKEYTDRQR